MENIKNKMFIEKVNIEQYNKYDYSLVVYKGSLIKVKIICPIHGEFEQTPKNHLKGSGCPKCARERQNNKTKSNTNSFINKSKLKHGDKYNYSLVDYVNAQTKINIICTEHGEFEQKPSRHLQGDGCPKCAGRNKNINDFVTQANLRHNSKYIYPLINLDDIKENKKIEIICPEHGIFKQKLSAHLHGNGCQNCGGSKKSTTNEFINNAKIKHGNKYDYSLVEYKNNKVKVKIICPKHGEFEQTPNNHLSSQGCQICKESKGEKKIRTYLLKIGVNFNQQHKFDDCRNIKPLPFDFYLPDYNVCIEFDGRQHYEPINVFGGIKGFNETQINDKIKTEYCILNKIDLIRIPYYENIYEKLKIKNK